MSGRPRFTKFVRLAASEVRFVQEEPVDNRVRVCPDHLDGQFTMTRVVRMQQTKPDAMDRSASHTTPHATSRDDVVAAHRSGS
jgi:hypothetical protein